MRANDLRQMPQSTPAHERQAEPAPRRAATSEAKAVPPSSSPPAMPAPDDALAGTLARAVARRATAPAGLLQRMNLGQTRWLPELKEIDTRTLVSDGREVKLYGQEAPEAPSKVAALQMASRLNALVGKTTDDKAYAAWNAKWKWPARNAWDSNQKWTWTSEQLNKVGVTKLDPFFYAVRVPYKIGAAMHQMELIFQHAPKWTGYVEAVYDSSNPATHDVPTMFDVGTESLKKGTKVSAGGHRNLRFSNVHDETQNVNVLTHSGGATDSSLDAYTKLAGEGARWQCVRAHAANLTDNSRFFIWDDDGYPWGITFHTLWNSWKSAFGKRYDITDAEVRQAMVGGLFGHRFKELKTLNRNDYDIDASQSYDP